MKHHNERLHALSRRLGPLWWFVARILGLGRYQAQPSDPRSFLLVDLHLLGDLVMLVPLLRVIRRYHPTAYVGLISGDWGRTILADTGLVDEFITLRAPWIVRGQGLAGIQAVGRALLAARQRPWDWGIDVRGDVRNSLILAIARARRRVAYAFSGGEALLTDVVADDGELRHIIDHHAVLAAHLGMTMTDAERIPAIGAAERAARDHSASRRLGFHFGASMALRRMPLQEACKLLLSFAGAKDVRLILVDAPDVADLNSAVLERLPATVGARIERWRGSLQELLGFLRQLDGFYAMDSGPAHLAAALGTPTTVFFGPHLSKAVRPMGPHVIVVERSDMPCRPCDQHHCISPQRQACLTQLVELLEPLQAP